MCICKAIPLILLLFYVFWLIRKKVSNRFGLNSRKSVGNLGGVSATSSVAVSTTCANDGSCSLCNSNLTGAVGYER
jgi:hypothetical protein